VSVAVSCFTLVAISLERYFAICHPLKSRSWQTLSHSYKAIAVCWAAAFLLMVPSAVYHDLVEIRPHINACVEIWPSTNSLKVFTVTLNLVLLVLPCILMSWAYGCVCYTLWVGIQMEKQSEKETQNKLTTAEYDAQNGVSLCLKKKVILTRGNYDDADFPTVSSVSSQTTSGSTKFTNAVTRPVRRMDAHRAMRQSNTERSRAAKKRVIKMLFMIVLEFFIFWSPTFVLDTWMAFHFPSARRHVTPVTKSLIHLLSYISTCCNPITYCFMNKNFRQSFLLAFKCKKTRYVYANKTQMSFTSGNTMSTRAPANPSTATSYDKIVDSDDVSENSF
ncbi:unnamed protein product, partial [Candidula unifasciata]